MKILLLPALLVLALAACSNDAEPAPESPAAVPSVADRDVRVRLGIVFTEGDPWMAGAVIDRGRVRVGDRLFLHTQEGRVVPVQITAIRDDATQSEVVEAAAPQGVFVSFKPEASTSIDDAGSEAMLLGDPEAASPSAR